MLSVFHMPFYVLQACCHVPSSQEWLLSGHSPIKPRLVKCCGDVAFWQVLPSQPRSSVVLSEWSLCSWSPPWSGPSCPVAQFGRMASSRKSLGRSIFFPFPSDGADCALGNFQQSTIVSYPSPDLSLLTILSRSLYGQFLGFHGRVSALTCTVNCGTWYRKVCFFLNHVQSSSRNI